MSYRCKDLNALFTVGIICSIRVSNICMRRLVPVFADVVGVVVVVDVGVVVCVVVGVVVVVCIELHIQIFTLILDNTQKYR